MRDDKISKATLVTSGQMYGSGKTTMGVYATESISMYPDVQARLEHFNSVKHSAPFGSRGLLEVYMESLYIQISMDDFTFPLSSLSLHLSFALYHSMAKALLKGGSEPTIKYFLDLELCTVSEVMAHFEGQVQFQKDGRRRSFFLHFDEVGIIESLSFMTAFNWKAHDEDLKLRCQRYYELWTCLNPLLKREGVYLFITDKSPAFALIGFNGNLRSPSKYRHLVLGALSPEDIVETFQKTTLCDGTRLNSYIIIEDSLLPILGKTVHDCTGGIPRLTEAAFQGLCILQGDPIVVRDEEHLVELLENCFHSAPLQKKIVCSFDENLEIRSVYVDLMVFAMLNQPISMSAKIKISQNSVNILQIIEKLNIFVDYPDPSDKEALEGHIRLKFPKWLIRHLQATDFLRDRRFPLVAPLLQMTEVLSTGAPFEYLLRLVVLFALELADEEGETVTWGQRFQIFNGTTVGDMIFKIDHKRPVCFVPGVSSSVKKPLGVAQFEALAKSESTIWSRNMNAGDWQVALHVLTRPSSVVQPAPHSDSPDLLFVGVHFIIAWAIKLNNMKNLITWSAIQDEIDKAAPLLTVKKVCLVITALHLGVEIEQALATEGISKKSLWSGAWGLSSSGVLEEPVENRVMLTIPEGMEVLLLGQEALKSFVGALNVDALEVLAEDRTQCPLSVVISALNAGHLRR